MSCHNTHSKELKKKRLFGSKILRYCINCNFVNTSLGVECFGSGNRGPFVPISGLYLYYNRLTVAMSILWHYLRQVSLWWFLHCKYQSHENEASQAAEQ